MRISLEPVGSKQKCLKIQWLGRGEWVFVGVSLVLFTSSPNKVNFMRQRFPYNYRASCIGEFSCITVPRGEPALHVYVLKASGVLYGVYRTHTPVIPVNQQHLPVSCLRVSCFLVSCLPVSCLQVSCLQVSCLPVFCLPFYTHNWHSLFPVQISGQESL